MISQALLKFIAGDGGDTVRLLQETAVTEPMMSWSQVSRSVLFFVIAYVAPDEARRVRATLYEQAAAEHAAQRRAPFARRLAEKGARAPL